MVKYYNLLEAHQSAIYEISSLVKWGIETAKENEVDNVLERLFVETHLEEKFEHYEVKLTKVSTPRKTLYNLIVEDDYGSKHTIQLSLKYKQGFYSEHKYSGISMNEDYGYYLKLMNE